MDEVRFHLDFWYADCGGRILLVLLVLPRVLVGLVLSVLDVLVLLRGTTERVLDDVLAPRIEV